MEGKRYNGGEEACEGRSRERECVRVQHTDRRLEAHSRRAIVNPSHAHTTHMPCTCHAHAMHMHMRVGWSSCCASSTSSTPSRTARCARAWYRCACYVVSLSSPPISTHLNPTLPHPPPPSQIDEPELSAYMRYLGYRPKKNEVDDMIWEVLSAPALISASFSASASAATLPSISQAHTSTPPTPQPPSPSAPSPSPSDQIHPHSTRLTLTL